ncbi:hypothetical protein SAMN04487925_114171 [Bradyrhizobium sp. cf659]|nr:hypothetical protein SAMN04487925_114171 [Bradyrhizobium sp. cf659]
MICRLWTVAVPNGESSPNHSLGLWVPAFAGTTAESVARACRSITVVLSAAPHTVSASAATLTCGGTGIGTVSYVFGRFTGR